MSLSTLKNNSPDPKNKEKEIIVGRFGHLLTASHTVLHDMLKSATYQQAEMADQSSLYSEKQFLEMHTDKTTGKCYAGIVKQDPLTQPEKEIIHDNYRREGATRRALDFMIEFMLGERTGVQATPSQRYANEAREKEALTDLADDPNIQMLLDELVQIDENVNLNDRMQEMVTSGDLFGHSVLVKQYDENHIPVRLIPLASIKLDKIYINLETWEFLGISYKDYQGDKRILKAEDIIHYEHQDFHITPNTRYYGLSKAETTMHVAASLRVTQEITIPEIRRQNWAPFHYLQFPDVHTQEKIDELSAQIQPGKTMVMGATAMQVTKVDFEQDLEKVHKSIEESYKLIFRSFGVPLIVAFQDEQNRATAQASLNQMTVSVLEKERTRLRNVMEPQWYIPNLRALIRMHQMQQGLSEPLAEYQDQGVVNALERSNKILQINLNPLSDIPFKPRMTFKNKTIDTFLEKSAAALGWLQANALTTAMALEVAGLEEYAERMQVIEEQKKQEAIMNAPLPTTTTTAMPMTQSQPQPQQQKITPTGAIPNFPIQSGQNA